MDLRSPALVVAVAALVTGCRAESPTPSAAVPAARPQAASGAPSAATSAIPVGAPPRVAYAFSSNATFEGGDWELIRPDGSRQPLPDSPQQLVVYDDRVVNGYGSEGGFVVEVIDPRGRVVGGAQGLCAYGLAITDDRAQVGWLDGRSLVTLGAPGTHERRRDLRVPPNECGRLQPVAIDARGVYADGHGGHDPVLLRAGRFRLLRLESLRTITDVTHGKAIGLRAGTSRCSAMVNLLGARRWQTCDHRLLDAAPDGRHVLGIVGPSRYGRARAVSLFTRTGELVSEWQRPAGARIDDVRWEDDSHVLAVLQDGAGWSLVRVGVDGAVEYAVAPRPTKAEDNAPFRLPLS